MNCGGENPDEAICGGVQGSRGPRGCQQVPLENLSERNIMRTDRPTRTTPSSSTLPPCPPLKPAAERITKEFCKYRDAGIYSHPYLCEYFVYCGVQSSRADVRKCPPGLNFNALIGVCDWKSNLECNLPREAVGKF